MVDSPYTFFALPIYKHHIPFGIIESMPNLDRAPRCPPLDTDYVPTCIPGSPLMCILHWYRYFAKRRVLGALGFRPDFDKSLVLQIARDSGVDPFIISFDRYFHLGLRNVPEFILSPQALDFPRIPAKNQVYVGPSVEMNRIESSSDYRFEGVFAKMIEAQSRGVPLVYCCLGTAAWRYKGAEAFLKRVLEVAAEGKWNLIIAVGTELDFSQFQPGVANSAVFQTVPQLKVLKHVDLMISHGGANSIAECILSGVPILVYPGTKQIDQEGNAARIVFHRLGLAGNLIRESCPGLIKKYRQY